MLGSEGVCVSRAEGDEGAGGLGPQAAAGAEGADTPAAADGRAKRVENPRGKKRPRGAKREARWATPPLPARARSHAPLPHLPGPTPPSATVGHLTAPG